MAKRVTEEIKELVLADFHTGRYTQRELAKKHDISKSAVNNIVKGLKQKHKDKVDTQIAIITELSKESGQEMDAFKNAVKDVTKDLAFFQNSALRNQRLANGKIDEDSELYDLKLHADITAKNKQSVLGKEADTQVNIQNNNQNNQQNDIETNGITVRLQKV